MENGTFGLSEHTHAVKAAVYSVLQSADDEPLRDRMHACIVMRTTANCHRAEGNPTTARRHGVPRTRYLVLLSHTARPSGTQHASTAAVVTRTPARWSQARPHGGGHSTPVRYGDIRCHMSPDHREMWLDCCWWWWSGRGGGGRTRVDWPHDIHRWLSDYPRVSSMRRCPDR